MTKYILLVAALCVSSFAAATYIEYETHSHDEENSLILEHSGGLDINGGHNCSEASKRKGLCYGYHYHR